MKTNNDYRQRNGNFETDPQGKKSFENRSKFNSPYKKNDGFGDKSPDRFKKRDNPPSNFGEKRNYSNSQNSFGERGNFNNKFNPRRGNSSDFNKKPYSSVPFKGERDRFSPSKEDRDSKFVETRFDNKERKVTFRPRKKSGNYDPNAKYSQRKQLEYQKTNIDPNKPIRLNKYLANAGVCSRREADDYIQAGVISVNGEIVSQLGAKVLPTDKIMFHNQPVQSERKVYILLNKPKDCVTTTEDTHARLTVLDLVKNACSERIYPVGRLDRNTTGVLLLTNDGDLASKLTHPKYEKKKIYHVVLDKEITREDFETILSGVDLDDFRIAADSLDFVKEDSMKELGIEIHTGQNRIIRRIFEKLGYKVYRLDRVYFAGLTKKNLPRGKYRHLNEKEVNFLKMGAFN